MLLVVYYPLGALRVNKIDDDPDFQAGEVAPGGSNAIAIAADMNPGGAGVTAAGPSSPRSVMSGANSPNHLGDG